MSQLFVFAVGLLKPKPSVHRFTTPIQRISENKLFDANILRIIQKYMYTPFYFTNDNVAVEKSIIIAHNMNGSTLHQPYHICELSDGCIAVVDKNESCKGVIRIYRDNYIVQNINHDKLVIPSGICTNLNGQLIVTDMYKNYIHVFDRYGARISSFNKRGSIGSLDNICVNSLGQIILVDNSRKCICVFDKKGNFIRDFTCYKTSKILSYHHYAICVDIHDNIYVIEAYLNYVIVKFSPTGAFIREIRIGSGREKIKKPWDIKISQDGAYIVVVDTGDQCVKILSSINGAYCASYKFKYDSDITGCCLTSDGHILVSDYKNKCIYKISKV
jgi:DNA-binding beta-propeller fold protein YncE